MIRTAAYFFCQITNSRPNNATAVLRTIVYLLVAQQRALLSHARERYDYAGKQLFEETNGCGALSEILI